ncbi:helix-turn-helix transcriptional regulator [Oceanicola sp. D3]|uniref:helix-turn-helix domain-containing protein n=1 Tax=Oceanicola sp. D3 TaxID=2587163 RepID=UPI0011234188|nr:helix-turn-helix transcriptional regulator [Oceanicola sp. D3]QDC10559.1 helix-turn-helix transcriptional regulator [Oceanicola sp. D3]
MSRRTTSAPSADEIMGEALNDLRGVLLGIACQIVVTSGDDEQAETFLGISLEDFSLGSMPGDADTQLRNIDLSRFWIARQIERACSFALQTGTATERAAFDEDDWNDLAIFLEGAPRTSFAGELTALVHADSALRRTLEMALARMKLMHGAALTIRELSLLAGIGETAVRTSLSADGIKTEGKPARVSAELADPWLLRRRGFVPTLQLEGETEAASPLILEIRTLLTERQMEVEDLIAKAEVDATWLTELLSGDPVACDVERLCRLASALGIDPAAFAGRAVEALLKAR